MSKISNIHKNNLKNGAFCSIWTLKLTTNCDLIRVFFFCAQHGAESQDDQLTECTSKSMTPTAKLLVRLKRRRENNPACSLNFWWQDATRRTTITKILFSWLFVRCRLKWIPNSGLECSHIMCFIDMASYNIELILALRSQKFSL